MKNTRFTLIMLLLISILAVKKFAVDAKSAEEKPKVQVQTIGFNTQALAPK